MWTMFNLITDDWEQRKYLASKPFWMICDDCNIQGIPSGHYDPRILKFGGKNSK